MKPIDEQQLDRIAERWTALNQRWFGYRSAAARDADHRALKAKLCAWHVREPLDLGALEHSKDADFAHDCGGIMRDDHLMSARCAAAYHRKREK